MVCAHQSLRAAGVSAEAEVPEIRLAELIIEPAVPQPRGLSQARTVGIVSVLTVIVAVFGYLREATLAARFGVSATMDAYFAAIFIPTMVYMVLIAGTLSPIFIPILLQEDANEDRAKLSETFSIVTNFVLLFLTAIVCCAIMTARRWLHLLFPGFSAATAEMTVRLVYMIFPSILFVAMAGILTAALNGFSKFALAAFAPALSSLTVIAATLFAHGSRAIYAVGIGTAVGFALQLLLLIPATASLGIRYRPTLRFRHPAISRLLRLGAPLFLYLAVANGALFLERNLASQLAAGSVSTLTYAMRLFAVPANFLAAPLAIVSYPQFAREALRDKHGDLRNQVSRMFRLVLFLFLPVTIFTILNAEPLTRLLYERGQFRLTDSVVTSRVLMLYGIGILPNALAVILLRCFYAVQDTITPLLAESVDLVFYATVATLLTRHFGIEGLAITRGLTFFLVTAILMYVLSKKRGLLALDLGLFQFVLRTVLASLAMTVVSWMSLHLLQSSFDSGGTPLRLGIVSGVLVMSSAAFLAAARLLKLNEVARVVNAAVELLPRSLQARLASRVP
jgi:putative peptidoglycan lipid II flippase